MVDLVLPIYLAFLSAGEWAIVLLIVVLLFGATKIPQLARSLGIAKSEFEKAARDGAKSLPETGDEDQKVLETAKGLGVPTEGRAIADVKKDIKSKLD